MYVTRPEFYFVASSILHVIQFRPIGIPVPASIRFVFAKWRIRCIKYFVRQHLKPTFDQALFNEFATRAYISILFSRRDFAFQVGQKFEGRDQAGLFDIGSADGSIEARIDIFDGYVAPFHTHNFALARL